MIQPALRSTDSPIKKRSVVIGSHKRSITLEDQFWEGLKHIARLRQTSLSELLVTIESARGKSNMSSATRLFVLDYYQSRLGAATIDNRVGELSLETEAVLYQSGCHRV
jgi:predicted DNA-binding ribbon-helix-helix protein